MARVLAVDDEPAVRDFLKSCLEYLGHQFDLTSGAYEAIAALESGPYDVVLTDIYMPGSSGIEVLEFAKREGPDTKVIVMSGFTSDGPVNLLEYAEQNGADRVLEKPFVLDDIDAALRDVLA